MKLFSIFSLLLITLSSCNQNPKHPQADLVNQRSGVPMTDKSILFYADSIEANLNGIEKNTSLVYQLGDATMYVEKYNWNGKPVLYAQYNNDEGVGNSIKKYYFKNDSLILVKEGTRIIKQGTDILEDERTYLRNNISFKKEHRSAASVSVLKTKPFKILQISDDPGHNDEFNEEIKLLNDAVNGANKFDLVFDNLISSPDEHYIILKSKIANGYNASILVKGTDVFIDSILNDPSAFKDRKLNIKWEIKDKEAIYVPVAASVTSASGLKR